MVDRCVCCGEIIPEGRQVCPKCRHKSEKVVKRYSIYHKGTDVPIMIYGTVQECAKAMGITVQSFYRHLCRIREGKRNMRKYDVYEDEVEDLEDG